MRLIDADQFEGFSTNCKGYDAKSYIAGAKAVLEVIDSAPTVDAVPAVRCGECRFYHPENGTDYRCDRPEGRFSKIAENPNGFCSYGERKDGEK